MKKNVTVLIKGIHCAACFQRIEKQVLSLPGLFSFNINYTDKVAFFSWEDRKISFDSIVEHIEGLGYKVQLFKFGKREQAVRREYKIVFLNFIVAAICSVIIMFFMLSMRFELLSDIDQYTSDFLYLLAFILSSVTIFYSGRGFHIQAWQDLKQKTLSMNFQISLSSLVIYTYSCIAAYLRWEQVYFESVAMFICFLLGSKLLESSSIRRMYAQQREMTDYFKEQARRLDDNGKIIWIDANKIQVNDLVEVYSGEKVLFDGVIEQGESNFDLSFLTGESIPILKNKGAKVLAGSVSLDGKVRIRVEKKSEDSTLNRIAGLVEHALSTKPFLQEKTDWLIKNFVFIVIVLSSITFLGWYLYGQPLKALFSALAVFIIACPCALGLSIPLGNLSSIASAIKRKIFIKKCSSFDVLNNLTDIVLDKTGTLTEGTPSVTQQNIYHTKYLQQFYALVKASNHPVAKQVAQYLENNDYGNGDIATVETERFREIVGRGISAVYQGKNLLVGGETLFRESGVILTEQCKNYLERSLNGEGSFFFFSVDKELQAVFLLKDQLKKNAKVVVKQLKNMGYRIHLYSGDNKTQVHQIAKECGIDVKNVRATILPKQKDELVEAMQKEGKIVMMCGDGINDAAALARAHIGIAMNKDIDLAVNASDIILLNSNVGGLLNLLNIAKQNYKLIRSNLILSIIYNFCAIPLAVCGLVVPLVAALSMSLSSIIVVGNSFYNYKKGTS